MSSEHKDSEGAEASAVSVKTMEIIVAVVVMVLGAMVIYDAQRIGSGWSDDGPKPGFFPFWIGAILILSSIINLVLALRMPIENFVTKGQAKDVLTVLLPMFVYVGLIQVLGIYVASIIYVAAFMVYIGKYSWAKALVVSVGTSVFFFFMFERWFKVPLIKGPLETMLGLG
jgi:putative tricarboxylic transport membrane protein